MLLRYKGPADTRIISGPDQTQIMEAPEGVPAAVFSRHSDYTAEVDPNVGAWLIIHERGLWEEVTEPTKETNESKGTAEVTDAESGDASIGDDGEGQLSLEVDKKGDKKARTAKGDNPPVE